MLQVTDHGANITLSGKAKGFGDGLFWFASALLIGAVGVALAMSLLPERLAIGALAVLIIGSFVFNRLRSNAKGAELINNGVLKVQKGMFVHNVLGKRQQIVIHANDKVQINGAALLITDVNGNVKCQVSGFDSPKEAQVMQAVLQGQKFDKRNANIRMQSN